MTASKSRTERQTNRNKIAINVQRILCRVVAGNAAVRRAIRQRFKLKSEFPFILTLIQKA
jgi:hypothetical protein